MPTVVGVKLRYAPKVMFFDPAGTEPAPGDAVIVETERGVEMGQVVDVPCELDHAEVPAPLRPLMRVATEEDLAIAEEFSEREREALRVYRSLIEQYKLDMKPVDVEYLFGGDKIVFYFVAEERVDFRELVRELASRYKARIDMRQVGVRDEARMVGGIAHCGQMLCCVRFAGDFQPVSIRMAKEQDLPLNPLKISGLCGRLMCCLRYEYEAYKDFKQRAPKKGAKVETPLGDGKVSGFSTPRETVMVRLAEGGSIKVPLEAMECPGGGCPCTVSAEALDALKAQETESALTGHVPALTETRSEPDRGSQKRRGGGRRKPEGARTEGGEEKASAAAKEAAGGSGGSGRSRRRRKSRGGGSGAASGDGQRTQGASGQPEAGAKAGDGSSAGGASSGRRRRRRRSSGPKQGDNAGE